MEHSKKRITLYLTTFSLLTACAILSTIQDSAAYNTAKIVSKYCLILSSTKRQEFRKLVNDQLQGHSIQIYCNEKEYHSWLIDANP